MHCASPAHRIAPVRGLVCTKCSPAHRIAPVRGGNTAYTQTAPCMFHYLAHGTSHLHGGTSLIGQLDALHVCSDTGSRNTPLITHSPRAVPFLFMPISLAHLDLIRLLFFLLHLQAYQANFRIKYASVIYSGKNYEGVSDPKSIKAIRICDIAFHAFFQDTKQLVAEGVRKDIKRRIAAASTLEEQKQAKSRGKIRIAALKDWLKSSRPLAYGKGTGNETFILLLRAVAEDEIATYKGLNGWEKNARTPFELVESLIDMSKPQNPKPPSAPVLKDGAFLPVLKVAHSAILKILNLDDHDSQLAFLNKMLLLALTVFEVKFVPSHLPQTGVRGGQFVIPVYDHWGHLGVKHSTSSALLLPDPDISFASLVEPETVAYNIAVASDCTAPWEANSLDLYSMKDYLNRTTLPSDFPPPAHSAEPYVNDTYTWVKQHYDGTKHHHHLALLVGIIVATSMIPNIFAPKGLRNSFSSADSPKKVRAVYSTMDWEPRAKKGMTFKPLFVSMVTTFIIALYEQDSPLMRHVTASKKRGLGDPWTDKYCAHSFNSLLFFFTSYSLRSISSFSAQPSRASIMFFSFVSVFSGVKAQVPTKEVILESLGVPTSSLTFQTYISPSNASSRTAALSPLSTPSPSSWARQARRTFVTRSSDFPSDPLLTLLSHFDGCGQILSLIASFHVFPSSRG